MKRRRLPTWTVVVGLLFCVRPSVSGTEAPSSQRGRGPGWHAGDIWRQPQGLPQNSVLAILQARDGYLWVGTKGGVARFDGARFTTFDDRDKSQLRENEVWALLEDDVGGLWIGTYGGGVSRWVDGRFHVYTAKDGLVNDFVRTLCKDGKGGILIGTDRGLSRFKDGRFENRTVENGLANNTVRALHLERAGRVWIGMEGGAVQRFEDGRLLDARLPEPRPRSPIVAFHRDRHDALWIGAEDGLFRLKGGVATRYTVREGLSATRIHFLYGQPGGPLWIVTAKGLDRRDDTAGAAGTITRVMTTATLRVVAGDREGSLWAGFAGDGLARLNQGPFVSYTMDDGLPHAYVSAVLEDRTGTVWLGTLRGLSARRADGFTHYGVADGLPASPTASLAEDRDGRLWVGTEAGLYRSRQAVESLDAHRSPRFEPVLNGELATMHVRALYQDRHGAIWAGTNQEGLIRYRDGHATTYTTNEGLSHNAVRAICEDRRGVLWVGTKGGGLNRLEHGRFTVYREKDGLPSDNIQALYLDPQDTLWIATRQGLGRFKDGRFTSYAASDGLYSSFVYGFVEDDSGQLWMSCSKGVFRVSKRELEDFAEGRIRSVRSVAYGREHGLSSTVGAVGHHPVGCKTRDGRVWFGTDNGVVVVDPRRVPRNSVPPPVHVEQVAIDKHPYDPHVAAEAPPGAGDLEFHYTALSFLAPEKVRFKYMLEGFDRDWIDADTRRVAYYTNTPPGRYTFRVKACNNDEVWNEADTAVVLNLAPHFYSTRWFYGACALGAVLLGAASQRVRVRLLKAREQLLRARVKDALAQIKVLRGLLPICASCKRIRDDGGQWNQMEVYIHEHSEAQFSHGICPECTERLYPDRVRRLRRREEPSGA